MAHFMEDPKIDQAARDLAELEGCTVTEAVSRALETRRRVVLDDEDERRRRIEATLREIWALPVLDPTDPDEMLYDEDGIPR